MDIQLPATEAKSCFGTSLNWCSSPVVPFCHSNINSVQVSIGEAKLLDSPLLLWTSGLRLTQQAQVNQTSEETSGSPLRRSGNTHSLKYLWPHPCFHFQATLSPPSWHWNVLAIYMVLKAKPFNGAKKMYHQNVNGTTQVGLAVRVGMNVVAWKERVRTSVCQYQQVLLIPEPLSQPQQVQTYTGSTGFQRQWKGLHKPVLVFIFLINNIYYVDATDTFYIDFYLMPDFILIIP